MHSLTFDHSTFNLVLSGPHVTPKVFNTVCKNSLNKFDVVISFPKFLFYLVKSTESECYDYDFLLFKKFEASCFLLYVTTSRF